MITHQQVKDVASFYKIDQFTIFREYLQLLFLSYLYQQKVAAQVYFKGGTALHLLFGSPRFSEDLDFSTPYSESQIENLVGKVEKELAQELPESEVISWYSGVNSTRFRLKYQNPNFKYPFTIRFDFVKEEKPLQKVEVSPLTTRFPLIFFPIITHYSPEELLAEKVRAFLVRAKGRDIFDLWFLLGKGIILDHKLIQKKLKVIGQKFDQERLIKKVETFPQKRLKSDLARFLPQPQRRIIDFLKKSLMSRLNKKGL